MAHPAKRQKISCDDTIHVTVGRNTASGARDFHLPRLLVLGRSKVIATSYELHHKMSPELIYNGRFPELDGDVFHGYVQLLLQGQAGSIEGLTYSKGLPHAWRTAVNLYLLIADLDDCASMNMVMDKLAALSIKICPSVESVKIIYQKDQGSSAQLRRLVVDELVIYGSSDRLARLLTDDAERLWELSRDLSIALLRAKEFKDTERIRAAKYHV